MRKLSLSLDTNYLDLILRSALLCIRGSRYNRVLKDVDEFSLAFGSAGL